MTALQPPSILRIKRKRNQDPLKALVLEDRQQIKRSKSFQSLNLSKLNDTTSNTNEPENNKTKNPLVFFKLARTDDSTIVQDQDVILDSILMESSNTARKEFILPKPQAEDETSLPNELSDMIHNYLKLERTQNEHNTVPPIDEKATTASSSRKLPSSSRNKRNGTGPSKTMMEEPTEYVYDVYYRDKAVHDQFESTNIGYIKFSDDNEDGLLNDDNSSVGITDDEDSNAESFYQNDYPEDEDAGDGLQSGDEGDVAKDLGLNLRGSASSGSDIRSDDEDDEFVIAHNRRRFSEADYMATEGLRDDIGPVNDEDFDYLYDRYYDEEQEPYSLLEYDNQSEFKRNIFFRQDVDDEMAIHRDKIFGKLEKLIESQDHDSALGKNDHSS